MKINKLLIVIIIQFVFLGIRTNANEIIYEDYQIVKKTEIKYDLKVIRIAEDTGNFITLSKNNVIRYYDDKGEKLWKKEVFDFPLLYCDISRNGQTILLYGYKGEKKIFDNNGNNIGEFISNEYDYFELSPNGEFIIKISEPGSSPFIIFSKNGETINPNIPEKIRINKYHLRFTRDNKIIGILSTTIDAKTKKSARISNTKKPVNKKLSHDDMTKLSLKKMRESNNELRNQYKSGNSMLLIYDPLKDVIVSMTEIEKGGYLSFSLTVNDLLYGISDKYYIFHGTNIKGRKKDSKKLYCYNMIGELEWAIPTKKFEKNGYSAISNIHIENEEMFYFTSNKNIYRGEIKNGNIFHIGEVKMDYNFTGSETKWLIQSNDILFFNAAPHSPIKKYEYNNGFLYPTVLKLGIFSFSLNIIVEVINNELLIWERK